MRLLLVFFLYILSLNSIMETVFLDLDKIIYIYFYIIIASFFFLIIIHN